MSEQKKIKLTMSIPVYKGHGATKGRIFDVIRFDEGGVFFMGDMKEEVKAWNHEFEVVDQKMV